MKVDSAIVLVLLCASVGGGASPAIAEGERSVLDEAVSTARIHSFTEILRNSGIPIERLRTEEVTLLIPVDISFYDLTPEQYERLLSPGDVDLAIDYVESHVIPGSYSLTELREGTHTTLNGLKVEVTTSSETTMINGAPLFESGIVGSNGYAHLIHGFLVELPVDGASQ
jgi:uncharacterized surface protein with fasciclin (FAS1) repeats